MAENDPKNTNVNNFDKEFSLNQKKKTGEKSKFPSWIMILVGVAVITGVVAAKQPVIRRSTNGTKASVSVPAGQTVTVNDAFYSGMNDEHVSSSELEARFSSHSEASASSKNKKQYISGDEQIFSMELEALSVDEKGNIVSSEDQSDSSVYWIDEKPYALTLKPADDIEDETVSGSDASVYSLDDQDYNVQLKPVNEDAVASLSDEEMKNVVHVGEKTYLVDLVPADRQEKKASLEDTVKDPVPAVKATEEKSVQKPTPAVKTDDKSPSKDPASTPAAASVEKSAEEPAAAKTVIPDEKPVTSEGEPLSSKTEVEPETDGKSETIAWMGEKPYAVEVNPYHEKTVPDPETEAAIAAGAGRFDVSEDQTVQAVPEESKQDTGKTDKTAEKQLSDDSGAEKESITQQNNTQTAVFETGGERYEIRLTEKDPKEVSEKNTERPVVWIEEMPLVVTLQQDKAEENIHNEASGGYSSFDIVLNPVPEEEMPALYEEHFGVPYTTENNENEPAAAVTDVPESVPSENDDETEPAEEEKENWFVSIFHNIVGSDPTATPVPQVTVIAMTPTTAPAKPTATPIIVQFVPTAAPQSPVRLDGPEGKAGTQKDAQQEDYSDWDDPALWEDENDTLSVADKRATVTAVAQGTATPTPTVRPTFEKIQVTLVDPGDNWPTAEPVAKELPQTGMAESWNIPSMLALLAGLLLIILGVRRLRTGSRQ